MAITTDARCSICGESVRPVGSHACGGTPTLGYPYDNTNRIVAGPLPLINLHAECERRYAAEHERAERIAKAAREYMDGHNCDYRDDHDADESHGCKARKALMDALEEK